MKISHLDHLVLTVADVKATCDWYHRVLDFAVVEFGDGRKALSFGNQKINLHRKGREFEPKAQNPTIGSADLCFIAEAPMPQIVEHLRLCGVQIVEGPTTKIGAQGAILSVYIRDPDDNLIEVSNSS